MMSVEATWHLLDAICPQRSGRRVPLDSACGCILLEDAVADADYPEFSRSAMDGYLIALADSREEYIVHGELTPGRPARAPEPGGAIRVFTGSAVPESGCRVVMQEDVVVIGNRMRLRSVSDEMHIRPRGSHARQGQVLVASGQELTPGRIALLASVGMHLPLVAEPVPVAHIVTGSELVHCADTPAPGAIRDSNSPLIHALLRRSGAHRKYHLHVEESVHTLVSALSLASAAEFILISGGASVGDHDHTRAALRESGYELLVEKINCRPGKPLVIAKKHDAIAIGLPGNPLSHFVCFHLFVRRLLARMHGTVPATLHRAKITEDIPANARESWLPCSLSWEDATTCATPLRCMDSSDITVLSQASALARVPSEGLASLETTDVLYLS